MKRKLLIATFFTLQAPFVAIGMFLGFFWYGIQLGRSMTALLDEEFLDVNNRIAERMEVRK